MSKDWPTKPNSYRSNDQSLQVRKNNKVYSSLYNIVVGTGKFLRVRRIFAQISPNLPDKNSKENDRQKNWCISFHVGHIFQIKALQAPNLPKFPPNLSKFPLTCPKRTKWKHDHQKEKNVCTLILVAISIKSKHIKRFCESFHTISRDFKGFFSDFQQNQKFWGCACTPAHPPPRPVLHINFFSIFLTPSVRLEFRAIIFLYGTVLGLFLPKSKIE